MSTTIISNEALTNEQDTSSLIQDVESLSIENKLQFKLLNEYDNEEKEDENDSDYQINEDEEAEQDAQEEEDDKLLDEICVNDNENENENENNNELNDENENKDINSEEIDVNKELSEALDIVRNVALKQKEIIVNKIYDEYQKTNGEEINPQVIDDAFELLKVQMNQNENPSDLKVDDEDGEQELDDNNEEIIEMSSEEEEDANENDEDAIENDEDAIENQNEEENELEEDEEDELEEEVDDDYDVNEEVSPKTTELIRQEIEEAMQIASELGKKAREELSQKYFETIIEATGEEPTQEQINSIFHRMQEQLSEEAQEELFDDCDDADAHDSINAVSQILAELNNMTDDEKKDAFEKAKDILPEDTQIAAKQQYIDISGREPNEQEYAEVIITLAQTKFTDAYFGNDSQNQNNDIKQSGVEEVDDDYDPEKRF